MTKSYIKLDPGLPDRKDYYPDGAFRALVTVFCSAAHQPKAGTFKSERVLKALLGRHSRWLPFLIEQRDVEVTRDGAYHVVGWEVWQEGRYPSVEARMNAIESRRGPMTPAERAFGYRQRKRDVERDASRDGNRDAPSDTSTPLHRTSTAVTRPETNGSNETTTTDFDRAMAASGVSPELVNGRLTKVGDIVKGPAA